MPATVLVCGKMFDAASEGPAGPAEIRVKGNRIASVGRSGNQPSKKIGAKTAARAANQEKEP